MVVLPAPLGPRYPKSSPCSTERLSSDKTRTFLRKKPTRYSLQRSLIVMTDITPHPPQGWPVHTACTLPPAMEPRQGTLELILACARSCRI